MKNILTMNTRIKIIQIFIHLLCSPLAPKGESYPQFNHFSFSNHSIIRRSVVFYSIHLMINGCLVAKYFCKTSYIFSTPCIIHLPITSKFTAHQVMF
jgi:hypothetical protein